MAVYTAEYTFPNDLSYQVYVKARQVKRNGVARTFASCTSTSADVWIDKTEPVVTIAGLYLNATATQNAINSLGFVTTATVYLAYSIADGASGISSATYRYGTGASATLTGSPMSLTLDENPTSLTTLEIKGLDNAGNFSTAQIQFYVDTTTPTSTDAPIVGSDGRTVMLVIPSFVATSNFAYNQFAFYNFSTDELVVEVNSDTNIGVYTFSDDLSYKVYGKAKQVKKSGIAGAYSASSSAVWVDITSPTLIVTSTDIATVYCTTATATVTTTATDAHSGIASVKAYVDGVTSSTLTNGAANEINLGSDSLNKNLKIVALDNASRPNSVSWERSFILDSTPPTGLESADISSKFGRNITWTIDLSSATDATSGLGGVEVRSANSGWGDSSYIYKGAEGTFLQTPTASSNLTLLFALFDKAGNYAVAVSSTAVHYPPALVSSASITYSPEINAVTASWDEVKLDSQGSATDAIASYLYFVAYKDSAGVYQYNSATQYSTVSNSVYIPIPIDKILTNGDNSIKIYIKAVDYWLASSSSWAVSDIMTTRRVVGADLAGNCFQFKAIAVQGDGTKTVNFTTSGETIDSNLDLLVDGKFDNA